MQPVPEQFTKAREIHGEERRLRIRRSPAALTYVTLGENNGGIVANISETGMSVTAGEPLRENVFSRVSFSLPQSERLIESRAEVMWTSESKKEAGLRFIDMGEETREQIRNWISPPRRNGKKVEPPIESTSRRESEGRLTAAATADNPPSVKPAEKSNAHTAGVESRDESKQAAPTAPPTESFLTQDKATTGPTESSRLSEAVLLQRLAASGSGPKSWAFTPAQRAEFERLFPSEIRGSEPRETAAPEIAAQSEPVVEPVAAASGFVSPIADSAPQPVATPAHELRAERSQCDQRAADDAPQVADPARMWRTAPATRSPRMPAQSLWDAPPPMLQPIIGGGFGSSYGAQEADSADESRPRSFWSIATLSILIIAACFALGFAEGPDLVRTWPMMEDVRQIVRDKLNHVKTIVTNRDNAAPTASSSAPAVTPNTSTNEQAATPAAPVLPAPATPAPTAPDATAPPAVNTAPDANAASNVAVPGNTPSGDSAPSKSASSENAGKSREANPAAPPALTEGAPASAAKEGRSEPSVSAPRTPESRASASRTPPKEAPVETPYTPPVMKAAPTVNTPREVSPPATASTHAAESSTPLGSSSMPSSPTPNSSTPSSSPAKTPSAPPVRAAAPAAHPLTSPPSYFPVVAPAAGNVPRLIELPEEKVIDTAAVVVHSHQIVFVPAEPGPESSHKLEKLRIGDRTTKLAPSYPAQAAQKGMGGTVHLRAVIGKDGNVQDVRPINGPITLIPAAVEAIRQWQYRPTLLDQQPIEMQEDFTIEFRPLGVQAKQ